MKKKREYKIILTKDIDEYNLKKGEIYYTDGLKGININECYVLGYEFYCDGQLLKVEMNDAEIHHSFWFIIKTRLETYFSIRCYNCKYYEVTDKSNYRGICFRYPPQRVYSTGIYSERNQKPVINSNIVEGIDVALNTKCGEFKRRWFRWN